MLAILVTTYNRPSVLERSLPQIAALGAPMLVVDDASRESAQNQDICRAYGAEYLALPVNRGLAAAMNIGLSFWLADKSVEWISYIQDDVDVRPDLLKQMQAATAHCKSRLYTGHDSQYHAAVSNVNGYRLKKSCAGVHMHARSDFWRSILPIPTFQLGAPKRIEGRLKGIGSNADWWIVRDSPNSVQKKGDLVVCVPGLVRTFLYKAADSSWGSELRLGDEPPLKSL